ncbi:MAG: chemotaxis response regulator protein-glutamate methylesterase [Litorimonas sp.]
MSKATLLIVDDSATLRAVVRTILSKDPDIEIVGEAADAVEARRLIKELNPDVITLDIEMPGMNGLQFLDKIMTLRPMPVIMLSSSTAAGSEHTLTALTSGAFHCIQKPASGNVLEAFSALPELVKAAAASPIAASWQAARTRSAPVAPVRPRITFRRSAVIGLGSSTGGADALRAVLSTFPENCPPTLIAQHMPEDVIRSFAARLDEVVAPQVAVARQGEPLKAGQVRFAPGGTLDLQLHFRDGYICRLTERADTVGHCPSVDVLFSSMARNAGRNAVGAILTGMGRDGAQGLLEMRQEGARTFGQDAATSIVYGMPRVAAEIGAVESQHPLADIGMAVLDAASVHAA